MAVSSSTDFALTAAELIEEARRKLGIHADEEALQAQELTTGLRALTMMLKSWQAEGVMAWTLTEGSFALVESDADYVVGSGGSFTTVPVDILDMRITRSGTDLPMHRMSREEYYALPNKTSEGYPTCWFYDRQRTGGTIYVWPVPDSTGGTLKFTYRRRIMDMDASADDIDLPQEWHRAIVYNLAMELAPGAGVVGTEDFKLVAGIAAQSYQALKGFDTGEGMGSIRITPLGYEE
jgi:hypothetical protein